MLPTWQPVLYGLYRQDQSLLPRNQRGITALRGVYTGSAGRASRSCTTIDIIDLDEAMPYGENHCQDFVEQQSLFDSVMMLFALDIRLQNMQLLNRVQDGL
jgi:hypothetical protein